MNLQTTNFMPVNFDQKQAEIAGASTSFFDGNSKQQVKITRAEFVISKNTGAQGIEFDVINKEGLKGYFTIWHVKNDGSQNEYSMRTLQSIMGVCGVQKLTPSPVSVRKYNQLEKQSLPTKCINAVEILGKVFIGLFVETYNVYENKIKSKIELFAAFNNEEKSYREMNAGVPAEDIKLAYDAMIKKSEKSKAEAEKSLVYSWPQQTNYSQQNAPPQSNIPPSIYDDIPF